MATLVLNKVGTALGGPVGGFIGALIGQRIDQRLFGGGRREGPRLGDLSVQGSRYGAPIPKVFGTMRVAGTIVWATDLTESETVTGAKGQPERVDYSYSANFLVALSARPGGTIGRIWADGKLLRGAAGDLKVAGEMRVLDGSEMQSVDPLIASIEADAPAYRGMTCVMFEGLELAEYGNRIPLLTFEIIGDQQVSLAELLSEASNGTISGNVPEEVAGYAIHGANIESAIAPLREIYDLRLAAADRRIDLSRDADEIIVIGAEAIEVAQNERSEPSEISSIPASKLPYAVTVDYYDPSRDYQAGRAKAHSHGGRVQHSIDAPMSMNAVDARKVAERSILRAWSERRSASLSLAPTHADLRPGDQIAIVGLQGEWRVEQVELERFTVNVRARSIGSVLRLPELPVDPGASLPSKDIVVGETELAMFETPDLDGSGAGSVLIAAANASQGWRSVALTVATNGEETVVSSAAQEARLGRTLTVLPNGPSGLFDRESSVDVEMVDVDHALVGCEDSALLAGQNLAMIGSELVQFGAVEWIAPGVARLSHFLRGRRGSEWAIGNHAIGDKFVLLQEDRLTNIALGADAIGSVLSVLPEGLADADAIAREHVFSGEGMRPPAPVHLRAVEEGGDLTLSWIRRSRKGFAWPDFVDAALGEDQEKYAVRVLGASGAIERDCAVPSIDISSAELEDLGAKPWALEVRMIGNEAISHPAATDIN